MIRPLSLRWRFIRWHAHRWRPMGAVSFTEYNQYRGSTSSRQQPALIYACDCGDWQWRALYGDTQHQRSS